MSFITDIVKYGLGKFGIKATGDTPAAIAKSAVTNYLKDRINNAFKKSNPPAPPTPKAPIPPQVRQTVKKITREVGVEFQADTEATIPVIYGEAWADPILVDANLSQNNGVMWYAVALCEVTGVKQSDNTQSEIIIEEVYLNGQLVLFDRDNVTVRGLRRNGSSDRTLAGLIEIYPYSNGSTNPTTWGTYQFQTPSHGPAYNYFPTWGSDHNMTGMAFALVKVIYNAQTEVKGIDTLKFRVRNTMALPGDCLYDYATNDIYGAGLDPTEIDF